MHPLGTKVYLLKRYSPSDRFWTFFSESELSVTWSFRNNYNLMICCSRNICDYYHQCWKQLCCFIYVCALLFSKDALNWSKVTVKDIYYVTKCYKSFLFQINAVLFNLLFNKALWKKWWSWFPQIFRKHW